MINQKIKVKLSRNDIVEVVPAVQADSGRYLEATISDYIIPPSAVARIYCLKPSGLMIYNDCAIENNCVLVKMTTQMLAEIGSTKAQIEITVDELTTTSFKFIIDVQKKLKDSAAIESTDEFTALEDAIQKCQELTDLSAYQKKQDDNLATTQKTVVGAINELNGKSVDIDTYQATFTEASTRTNIASGETISTIFGKVKKYFTDLKTVAFSGSYNDLSNKPSIFSGNYNDLTNKPTLGTSASNAVANNLTTTVSGSVLDARQGKALSDSITATNSNLTNVFPNSISSSEFVLFASSGAYSNSISLHRADLYNITLDSCTIDGVSYPCSVVNITKTSFTISCSSSAVRSKLMKVVFTATKK